MVGYSYGTHRNILPAGRTSKDPNLYFIVDVKEVEQRCQDTFASRYLPMSIDSRNLHVPFTQ